MGKGDKRSRKGKIIAGSSGKSRLRLKTKVRDARKAALATKDVVEVVETATEVVEVAGE